MMMISDPRARRVDTTRRKRSRGATPPRPTNLIDRSICSMRWSTEERNSTTTYHEHIACIPCRQHSKQSVDKTVTGKLASSLFLRDRSQSVSFERIDNKPWKISHGTDHSSLTSLVRLQIIHTQDLFIMKCLPHFNWCHGQDLKKFTLKAELLQGHQNKNHTESRGLQRLPANLLLKLLASL